MIQKLPQTASVHELQRNYRRLFDRLKEKKAPLYLLKNNKPEVVIVDYLYWENIARHFEELDLKDSLGVAREEKALGKIKKLDSLANLIE